MSTIHWAAKTWISLLFRHAVDVQQIRQGDYLWIQRWSEGVFYHLIIPFSGPVQSFNTTSWYEHCTTSKAGKHMQQR